MTFYIASAAGLQEDTKLLLLLLLQLNQYTLIHKGYMFVQLKGSS